MVLRSFSLAVSRPVLLLAGMTLLAACSRTPAPIASPEPVADAKPTAQAKNTHDGAVPIAVVRAWDDATRTGRSDMACELVTATFKEALVTKAAEKQLITPDAGCRAAVSALVEAEVPTPIRRFVVDHAYDDETALTVKRTSGEIEQVMVVLVDGLWLLDAADPV